MKNKLIKKVLVCRPTYFSVDYVINPWMKPGTADTEVAMKQWKHLVQVYKKLGIEVNTIEQGEDVPDMVFAADQGIVQDKKVLLSRFRHRERRGESKYYEAWFSDNDYKIHYLPENVFFEGNGEMYFWNDLIFLGVGYRSSDETIPTLQKIFDREVIPLQITDPRYYHLDVAMLPLNNQTVFYYPHAYTLETQKILQKKIPNLLEFSQEEVLGFGGNSVITDHHVVLQKGNHTLEKKLQTLGYKTVPVDVGEFIKSGGGAHCLTNVLKETVE
ncbi:MAG: arginine deiminase family protein [Patescibacteria group bacterium]